MSASAEPDIIYVVGNGPSLRDFDFAKLDGQRWVGMNAAYRHWVRTDRYPTYYACLDRVVGLSHVAALADLVARAERLGIGAFLLDDAVADAVEAIAGGERIVRASSMGWDDTFTARVTTGSHAVLWAAAMGCDEIHLLGIDQNYVEDVPGLRASGDGALEVAEDARSPNYYFPDYQRVGDRLNRPNPVPQVHATAWRRVMSHMRRARPGLRVVNHSPVSDIPGTVAVAARPLIRDVSETIITAAKGAQWRDILPEILPRRFTSLSVEGGLDQYDFGAGWQPLQPGDAPHRGRWHLHVQTSERDPGEPELGSVLFLPGEGARPDWYPEGLHWFDNALRVESVEGATIGILALRVDSVAPPSGVVGHPNRLRRAFTAAERMARRTLRRARSALRR